MSEPKWTPGPWAGAFHLVLDRNGRRVAEIPLFRPSEANRDLIAAAPELYEALSAAMKFIELSPGDPDVFPDQWEAWKKYVDSNPSQALAKARGES